VALREGFSDRGCCADCPGFDDFLNEGDEAQREIFLIGQRRKPSI
jgi:hypothetical protein